MISISTSSAAVAGFIIGVSLIIAPALAKWGGVLGWAGLHAVGGVMGGVIGVILITALIARGIQTQVKQTSQLGKQANAL